MQFFAFLLVILVLSPILIHLASKNVGELMPMGFLPDDRRHFLFLIMWVGVLLLSWVTCILSGIGLLVLVIFD